MSYAFDSRLGAQLYQLLPEVYRSCDRSERLVGRSGNESLARYLDAHGHLLDLIHATLRQQLDDVLPESSQDWLLPYFARLLAANIVAPDSAGRRAELSHAIAWRQRKGTLRCVEEIAEAIGQMEVEIQEGWKRVAMTPRIGMPLIPAQATDDTLVIAMQVPSEAVRHPGLPAVTVDLRRPSRAVQAIASNPAARQSVFSGIRQTWRQLNPHAAPCFPGSFEDVSVRTLDIRSPANGRGYYHHKQLLAYTPPPNGMFPDAPVIRSWQQALAENLISLRHEPGRLVYSNNTLRSVLIHKASEADLVDEIALEVGRNYRIENLHFSGTLSLAEGQLSLHQVVAQSLRVDSFSTDTAVLSAQDCLFNQLSVGSGIAQLASCTVRHMAYLKQVDIIDSILMDISDPALGGTIQYSRIPAQVLNNTRDRTVEDCNADTPAFFANQTDLLANAVLAPNTPESIYAGASDAGEMGYFQHGRRGKAVRISGDFVAADGLSLQKNSGFILRDLVFTGLLEVQMGTVQLQRVALKALTVKSALSYAANGEVEPAVVAMDCLFDGLTVIDGLARLEYCSVMGKAACRHLQASDCLFAGLIINVNKAVTNKSQPAFLNCLRYCRIPPELLDQIAARARSDPLRKVAEALRLIDAGNQLRLASNTLQTPVFIRMDDCDAEQQGLRTPVFGEPGFAVLDPLTADAIRFGAEDGGEIGVGHHLYYSLRAEAVLDKLREFLPVGIEPLLIQDLRLRHSPPS